ncbi:DPP IV N-terminal domain-containing protein [Melittangium boletus]|uniref:S9 family peptidase n=1 Tax=Melittangium boletus TaxID=83453 RepID=UPI003DA1E684
MRQAPFLLAAALLASACAPVLTQHAPTSAPSSPASSKTMSPSQEAFLRDFAQTRRFMSGRPVSPRFTPDEKTILFLRGQPRAPVQTLFAFDVATGQTRELLTPESLLKGGEETLTAEEKARRERMRVSARGFTSYQLSEDGASILVPLSGRLYLVDRASGRSTELKTGAGVIDPRFSADGKHVGYVRDQDVYRLEVATNTEHRVTQGGTPQKTHGLAEFVAQEEMSRFSGWWWSPDARFVAYTESDTSGVENLSILDVMHPERGAEDAAYPRPGKANAKVRLGVTPAAGGPTVWVKWDAEAYPYLATVVWPKKGPLTLLVQNRTQTEQKLLAVDLASGATRELLTEKDAAWLELDQSFPQWVDEGFLWYTERNGGPEVELRGADGALVRSLVKPEAGLRGFVRYLEKERTLYFNGGPNPTESYLWRVKDGGAPEAVRPGTTGEAVEGGTVSKTGALVLVTHASPTSMPRSFVARADGSRVGELPSVAVEPSITPRVEFREVGPLKFHTSLVRPSSARPGEKLPVIVDVYAGPTVTVVHKSMAAHLLSQWMADQGFLIARIDGRGTPLRGAQWQRAVHLDFSGVTLEDQAAGIQALAAEVPEVDLSRVGIEGWSFGGYMAALAALKGPDVFKAAVAGAPVVDWLDYDTHYTERYLRLPQTDPEAYAKSSLLTYASDPARSISPLLLIHGTADDNVYFFHTLKLSDALFRAGKYHELLPLSGLTHMVPDPLITQRQYEWVMNHFKRHLRP